MAFLSYFESATMRVSCLRSMSRFIDNDWTELESVERLKKRRSSASLYIRYVITGFWSFCSKTTLLATSTSGRPQITLVSWQSVLFKLRFLDKVTSKVLRVLEAKIHVLHYTEWKILIFCSWRRKLGSGVRVASRFAHLHQVVGFLV